MDNNFTQRAVYAALEFRDWLDTRQAKAVILLEFRTQEEMHTARCRIMQDIQAHDLDDPRNPVTYIDSSTEEIRLHGGTIRLTCPQLYIHPRGYVQGAADR